MKKLLKLFVFNLAVGFFGVNSASADNGTCPIIDGVIDFSELVVNDNGFDYNCNYTPDSMKIRLFKISLCNQLPTLDNYGTICEQLVNFSGGKDVIITADDITPILDGSATLKEGVYSHAIIMIENRVASKFTQTFNKPVQGNNGAGTTCWSNGNDAKISYEIAANAGGDYTKFSASCGTLEQSDPRWSYYTYKGLWNPGIPGNSAYFINSTPFLTGLGYGKDIHLLSDFSTLATVDAGASGRNLDDENGITSNANYIMGVSEFSTPQDINPNTQKVELGFKLVDTFFQKITTNNNYYGNQRCSGNHGDINTVSTLTGSYACLSTSYATSFDFRFSVE
jgi:hypothetical protein